MNGADKNEEYTLDAILVRIGQFGQFQIIIFCLICFPMMFHAAFSVTYVFTAGTVIHRCNITGCDTPQSQYYETWTNFSIPKKGKDLDKCSYYANNLIWNEIGPTIPENICLTDNFDNNTIETCFKNNFIFRDKEITISNDFGIYCDDEWMLSLVGTINNLGQFVGMPIGGLISDRYGRKTSVALGGFFGAILGILRSYSANYLLFLIFEFLDNVMSSTLYSTCFILGIELVGPKHRALVCSIITIFYAVGEIFLAILAKYFQDWRSLLRIVYTPSLILIVYFWILPESVRWLLGQGKGELAKDVLRRAAKVNQRKLSEDTLDKMVSINCIKLEKSTEGKFPIKDAFRNFFWRIANCSFCWIVHVLVYYGLSLNAVNLDGDKYNNFAYMALVEIPGFFLPLMTMDHFGRRYSLFGYMMLGGACCLAMTFVDSDNDVVHLILFLLGKLAITASFQVLYFFTSEIFPTNLRNSLLSFCSMIGRFGSMLAPQTPLLGKYYANAPAILFGSTVIVSGLLTLCFPETMNLTLPTTVQEADALGSKSKKKQVNDSKSAV